MSTSRTLMAQTSTRDNIKMHKIISTALSTSSELRSSAKYSSDELEFLSEDLISNEGTPIYDIDEVQSRDIAKLEKIDPTFYIPEEITREADALISNGEDEMIVAAKFGYDTSSYHSLLMGGRIVMRRLVRRSPKTILEYVRLMSHLLNKRQIDFMAKNHEILDYYLRKYSWCNYRYDYLSAMIMHETYVGKEHRDKDPIETPVLCWMRVTCQEMHAESSKGLFKCFKTYSKGYATPASPTIFNAGLIEPQMSSCFVFSVGDNMKSIQASNYLIGMVSASGGGLGGDISNVRAVGAVIRHRGTSKGIIPIVHMYYDNIKYVKQGAQRNGAMSLSLRPHHLEVQSFLDIVDPLSVTIEDRMKTLDLSISLWTSWLFWDRVIEDGNWTLFCPGDTPEFKDVYGKEFERRYKLAELNPNITRKKVIKASELLDRIIKIQTITGKPYILHGDSANFKSAHKHIGPIRSSNLCNEIMLYTDENTVNVCNLKSVNLCSLAVGIYKEPPSTLDEAIKRINFKRLMSVSWDLVIYLNKVIDNNFYPLDEDDGETLHRNIIHKTNMRFRALGIGVSGMAELFASIDLSYISDIAGEIDKLIFACIYFNTLASSIQEAIYNGKCDVFDGSPFSQGKLQFHLWQEEYLARWCTDDDPKTSRNPCVKYEDLTPVDPSVWGQTEIKLRNRVGEVIDIVQPRYDDLIRCIVKYGLNNSMLTSVMPTASVSKSLRNSESCEPQTSNIYSSKLLCGSFPTLNRFMVSDLTDLDLWNDDSRNFIINNDGKIVGLTKFLIENCGYTFDSSKMSRLSYLEEKYLTVYEIKQNLILNRAMKRGIYIDQSQSTNIHMEEPTNDTLKKLHLYTNYLGLKTGMYYLRTRSSARTSKFTVNQDLIKQIKPKKIDEEISVCRMEEGCLSCS